MSAERPQGPFLVVSPHLQRASLVVGYALVWLPQLSNFASLRRPGALPPSSDASPGQSAGDARTASAAPDQQTLATKNVCYL